MNTYTKKPLSNHELKERLRYKSNLRNNDILRFMTRFDLSGLSRCESFETLEQLMCPELKRLEAEHQTFVIRKDLFIYAMLTIADDESIWFPMEITEMMRFYDKYIEKVVETNEDVLSNNLK